MKGPASAQRPPAFLVMERNLPIMNLNRLLMMLAGLAAGGVMAAAVWRMSRRNRPVVDWPDDLDAIDLASDDSFPASDPPSYSGAHA